MSSGGHARQKLRNAPKELPLDREYPERVYIIDQHFADVLANELGVPSAVD